MKKLILNLYKFIMVFFWRKKEEIAEKPLLAESTDNQAIKRIKEIEPIGDGEYGTISELLDDLDQLFADMSMLKPKKKHAQKMIKRYGPYVLNINSYKAAMKESWILGEEGKTQLGRGFKAYGLPAMLILYWNDTYNRKKDLEPHPLYEKLNRTAEFSVATKSKKIDYLIPAPNCCVYEFTYSIVDKESGKPIELYAYIEVNETTGNVRAMPVKNIEHFDMKKKRNDKYARHFSCTQWDYPTITTGGINADYERKKIEIERAFIGAYDATMTRESGINILVKKNKNRATFTIPQGRWKNFFKDRLDVKTASGRKRPIFHAVSSHLRELKSGVVPVKTHYKGSRHFVWNGYEVKIILQGKHATSQASFNLAGIDEGDMPDNKKMVYMDSKKASGMLNKLFEGE